jgi:putative ABC transport system permease protein
MYNYFLKIVYLSLKNRRLRSWLTMIGIIIGIAAVVSLIGIGEGLRVAIISQFDFLATDVLTVQGGGVQAGPPGSGVVNPLTEDNVDKIEKLKGVDIAIGRIIESSKIKYNGKIDFTYSGSMPDGERRKEVERIAQLEIEKGRMLKDGDGDVVVLGNNFLKADRFGKPVKLRDDVTIQGKEFKVIGFLEKKGNFIIDNAVTMNEDVMRDLFNKEDTHDMILVRVAKGFEISQTKENVEEFLRKERDVDEGEEDFSVESSEQAVDSLNSTLFAVQIFFYVIAGISIIVGGIGISNTMYTSVLERTKDIGVMKSIGAKNKDIFTLFFIESGLLGTVGGILGIIVGLSIAYLLVFAGKMALGSELIALRVSPFLIIGALLFSFLIGTIAGVLPAYGASKMNPVDALRK